MLVPYSLPPWLDQGREDLNNDAGYGFQVVTADDIDTLGIAEIIKYIRKRIGELPVYFRCARLLVYYPKFCQLNSWNRKQFRH